MRKHIRNILIFLVLFTIIPQIMTNLITIISGKENDKIIFFFSGIAFLISYIFKVKFVKNIFKPNTFLAYCIYFTLVYVIIIAILCLIASFLVYIIGFSS